MAPPRFLGDMRGQLSNQARQRVVASIHRDLTHVRDEELPELVRARVQVRQTAGQ